MNVWIWAAGAAVVYAATVIPMGVMVWRQRRMILHAKTHREAIAAKVDAHEQDATELRQVLVNIFEACETLPPEQWLPILRKTEETDGNSDA
jgi:hypothetical protein